MTDTHPTEDYQALIVADDRTGAHDAGDRLAARGFDTVVPVDGAPAADVLVRDVDTRYEPRDVVTERLQTTLSGVEAEKIYLKVDSTLRGAVGTTLAAARRETGADIVIFAPAFPAAGRVTAGGYHLLDGRPVTETPTAADRAAPDTAYLPALLEQTGKSVSHLPLSTIGEGARAITAALAEIRTPSLVACDATTDSHLRSIARGAAESESSVIYAGSAGLAGQLPLEPVGAVLGVVGSRHPQTLAQIGQMADAAVVDVDAADLISSTEPQSRTDQRRAAFSECDLSSILSTVTTRLDEGKSVLLTAATDEATVGETLTAGRNIGWNEAQSQEFVEAVLARTARAVVQKSTLHGLVLTGGATAAAVLDSLDARLFRLSGTEVEGGIPLGRVEGGLADGLPTATKAGGFGDEETLCSCFAAVEGYSAS